MQPLMFQQIRLFIIDQKCDSIASLEVECLIQDQTNDKNTLLELGDFLNIEL